MNYFRYISVILVFMLLAIGSGSDSGENTSSYMDSADSTQKDFFEIVTKFDSIFESRAEGNNIQFQQICESKDDALREYFNRDDIKNFKVENWYGEVQEVQSIYGGGGLKVLCNSEGSHYTYKGTNFYLNTTNDYEDVLLSYTAIKKSSDLYQKLSTLKKESIIKFSGKFIKSPRAYRRTYILSNSEYANADQEYVFQFTDVAELKSAN